MWCHPLPGIWSPSSRSRYRQLCHLQPVLFAFLAEVALDDEITPPLQKDPDVLGRVVAGVEPEEQGLIRQLAAYVDGLIQKLGGAFLAVLFSLPQLQVGKVALAANIGEHGGVAVAAFISPGHALLAGLRVVERRDVHVDRDTPAGEL